MISLLKQLWFCCRARYVNIVPSIGASQEARLATQLGGQKERRPDGHKKSLLKVAINTGVYGATFPLCSVMPCPIVNMLWRDPINMLVLPRTSGQNGLLATTNFGGQRTANIFGSNQKNNIHCCIQKMSASCLFHRSRVSH